MKSKNEDERKDFMKIDLVQEEEERSHQQNLFLDISNDELVKAIIDKIPIIRRRKHKKTLQEAHSQTISQEVNVQVGINSRHELTAHRKYDYFKM